MWKSIILSVGLPLLAGAVLVLFLQNQSDQPSEAFLSECQKKVTSTPERDAFCENAAKTFFTDQKPVQKIDLVKLGAPSLKIDSQIRFAAFYDYRYVAALTYCYFASRKWFNSKTYSPLHFAKGVAGFAVLSSELEPYKKWLETPEGFACRKRVEGELGLRNVRLLDYLKDHSALVAINPIAMVENRTQLKSIIEESRHTVNHERVHVLHVSCKNIGNHATKIWTELPEAKKNNLKMKLPDYNWKDPVVGEREYLAFLHEKDPSKLESTMPCQP